jgi:hypothetical protein
MQLAVSDGNKRSANKFEEIVSMSNSNLSNLSKQRQVINHLYRGWGIDAREALLKYDVKNLRATMSSIRELVEKFGNWEIVTDSSGRYFMADTHPGDRAYKFRKDGSRFLMNA